MDNIFSDKLTVDLIRDYCVQHDTNEALHIHIFESIDSTNDYLKKLPYQHTIDICCANTQTQGRGRLGRQWYSPPKGNIYCSMRWKVPCSLNQLPPMSIVTALAIVSAFQSLSIAQDIQVKWPNDLYWHEKKLGGILIESITETDGQPLIVIGIGLNINIQSQLAHKDSKIDRPWCSLRDITGQYWCRNLIIGAIFTHLDRFLKQYIQHGLKPLIPAWEKVDWLLGQSVRVVLSNTQSIEGIASGITETGQLRICDNQGKTHYVASGEATRLSYG